MNKSCGTAKYQELEQLSAYVTYVTRHFGALMSNLQMVELVNWGDGW